MKIHNKLDEILGQPAKIKILRFLFNNKAVFTGRAIARASGLSVSHSYEALQDLKAEGLVNAERQGRSILYELRRDNYIVKKMLAPLYEKEKDIYKEIISIIKRVILREKKYIHSVAIFGSVAGKNETLASDVDLFVVTKDKKGKSEIDRLTDRIADMLARQFGAALSPYILTKVELKNKYNKKISLIKSIVDNNKLIYGEPIERIVA